MKNRIVCSVLILFIFMALSSLVLAQGTGSGGVGAPQSSNNSAGGGGGMVNSSANVSYDFKIYEAFNSSEWVRIIVYYDAKEIDTTFNNLEEREEYIRNKTKSTFSYISDTEMKIIQTSLEPGYFGAKITKEGFDILVNDSKISKIYLDTMGSVADEDETISKNKSTTEEKGVLVSFEIQIWILIGIIVVILIIVLYAIIKKKK